MSDELQVFLDAITAGDEDYTESVALTLSDLSDEGMASLRRLLEDDDPDRRWWATRALVVVGDSDAAGLIIGMLDDPDPDVRACAVFGLSILQPLDGVEPLVARLSDPSAYVARLAADALAQFGASATEVLILALEKGDTATRAGAARALRVIQPEDAIPALSAALDDPSAIVTHYAEDALERMGVGLVLFRP